MRGEAVRILPYDPRWPGLFEAERSRLEEALRPWLAGPVEHIGSTAVPGLAAKPVVDIMAGVRDLASSLDARAAVAPLDYVYHPYRADVMHWFCKPSPLRRTHHLHLVPLGSALWTERLRFRDHLRADPGAAAEYAALKVALARRHASDREAYTRGKDDFVRGILRRAAGALAAAAALLCGGAAAAQDAPVRLEPVVRIGCADCDGPALFTNIHRVAITADRVWVLDGSAPHVRVFDHAGAPVRAFGRQGDGPGEFRFPIHLGLRPGGVLEVFDFGQGRLTRLDSLGRALGSRPLAAGEFPVFAGGDGDGPIYIVGGSPARGGQRLLRLDEGAAEPVALPVLSADFPVEPPGAAVIRPAIAVRPGGGVAVGDGRTQYRIRVFDGEGSLLREIVRRLPRPRKTEAELARERAVRDRIGGLMATRLSDARQPEFQVDPERVHFSAMAYDGRGRLWVRTRRGDPDGTTLDLFDAGGRYLGEVRIPAALGSFAFEGSLFAARIRDALGVEQVAVWRVRDL